MVFIASKVKKDSQARSYQITQNNPSKYNITRESFKETILKFKPIYFCISEEIGIKEKTPLVKKDSNMPTLSKLLEVRLTIEIIL